LSQERGGQGGLSQGLVNGAGLMSDVHTGTSLPGHDAERRSITVSH
jgi:hypothetical protein